MSPPPEPPATSPGGGFLTQKYFGLPAWAWFLIVVAAAYLFMRYKSSKSSSTSGSTGTQATGTGTTTGTSNNLSSNLVAVAEPQPVLDGTYTVSVQPAVDTYSNNGTTTQSSTQGLANSSPPSDTLESASAPENPGVNVTPQTQPSSPQTQTGPVS